MSSRVTLWFDVLNSPSLSQEQKDLILRRLAHRIGRDGVLRVISQQTRSQSENKGLAVERFVGLLRDALKTVQIRKKTRVSRGAKLRRMEEKKRHSRLKHVRAEKIPTLD